MKMVVSDEEVQGWLKVAEAVLPYGQFNFEMGSGVEKLKSVLQEVLDWRNGDLVRKAEERSGTMVTDYGNSWAQECFKKPTQGSWHIAVDSCEEYTRWYHDSPYRTVRVHRNEHFVDAAGCTLYYMPVAFVKKPAAVVTCCGEWTW